ncbi:MAG TPA: rhomboid family intramembrane serine protease [Terriglobales bacterium]
MMNCNTCGREIAAGADCPYCGAHNPVAPGISTPGVIVSRRVTGGEISATHVIVGINIAVFLGMALSGASLLNPSREQLLRWGANWGPLSLGTQPWRMLTSNYVHIGLIHILFNMWCLWNLGRLAERVLGRLNYVVLYTFCGLAGSLASLWWHPLSVGAGASGAIFGLAGAAIAVFYLGHLPIAKEAISGTMRSLLTFVGYNLFFGLTPGIDNSAHIGGLVAGLAMGAALSKHIMVAPDERRQWARLTWIVMAVVLLLGNVAVRRQYPQLSQLANPQVVLAQQLASAKRAMLQHRTDEAISQLQEIIEQQPKEAEPRYLLGEAYLFQRKPDQAIAAFQEALRLKPDYAEAEAALGSAYLDKGMKPEAEAAFRKAAELGYTGE